MRQVFGYRTSVLILISSLGVVSCGSAVGDYCDAWAKCEGGNDKDRDACVASHEGSRNTAAAYDCLDEWDAKMECEEKYASCDTSNPDNPRYRVSDGACNAEDDKLDACIRAASATRD